LDPHTSKPTKFVFLIFIFLFFHHLLFAQEKKETENEFSLNSYVDFTKEGNQFAIWSTYDHKKISADVRWGYDWDKNISFYVGPLFKYKNWKFRIIQGVTFGNKTGISFSPTSILDNTKLFIFNQPQYIIGLGNMPSNFSHWGSVFYKVVNFIWFGITDRYYLDKYGSDFAVGPQLSLSYKNFFITFYWWIPSNKTLSKYFLEAGYDKEW
jgi:hypothetical protein